MTAYEVRISDLSSDVCSSDLNTQIVHHVNQALKAIVMFKLDTDYIVKDGKVVIIDEFTGRMMDGRRWSDGLHQAVEAKEGVQIEPENQTLASITFRSEEHTSELQSLMRISYAVFCLKKNTKK